jgi:bifunctional DNA-binding transcriptional regulator/antitoxin component of YhaV-PrlF toxin-antitoxin module
MPTETISRHFQVVIPNEVRDALHINTADLTGVHVLSNS